MINTKMKPSYIMTFIIALFTFVAAAGGLFIDGLYKDTNSFILDAWYANDIVVLLVGLPLLIASLILSINRSLRGQLIWLGMLNFTLYNYSYYLFGAAFNNFFLIYVVLFTLSMYSIIFGLVHLDYRKLAQSFNEKTPVKGICIFMILLAVTLGGAWLSQWFNFVVTGNPPQIMVNLDSPTNLVATLDLTLVVPFSFVAAYFLWNRRPIGYVLAIMLNVKGFVYNLVLILGSIVQEHSKVKGAMDLVPLWVILCIGCLLSFVLLIMNLKPVINDGKTIKKIKDFKITKELNG
jgi:hypothetical protein